MSDGADLLTSEGKVCLYDALHLLLYDLEVCLGQPLVLGRVKVVVEAALYPGPDRDLHARPQPLHSHGHDVRTLREPQRPKFSALFFRKRPWALA